ncbi:MAG TPA: hypothetical protein VEY10_07285 [Flavisolibacter sp.]|nr:hypothetical protein [Flavisolibacter sp.]
MTLTKKYGFALIFFSFLLAWFIANAGVEHQKLEMAAIANIFIPPICGGISLLLFAIIDYFFKRPRLMVVILLVLVNLCIGIAIRWESAVISSR